MHNEESFHFLELSLSRLLFVDNSNNFFWIILSQHSLFLQLHIVQLPNTYFGFVLLSTGKNFFCKLRAYKLATANPCPLNYYCTSHTLVLRITQFFLCRTVTLFYIANAFQLLITTKLKQQSINCYINIFAKYLIRLVLRQN